MSRCSGGEGAGKATATLGEGGVEHHAPGPFVGPRVPRVVR
ncbi:MAG TPA: hypothetical protein VHQ65_17200 [Thermoanaerobaculia bacterium]|nr:hypothetical protein [Thermoanaerobaculia bacterium]